MEINKDLAARAVGGQPTLPTRSYKKKKKKKGSLTLHYQCPTKLCNTEQVSEPTCIDHCSTKNFQNSWIFDAFNVNSNFGSTLTRSGNTEPVAETMSLAASQAGQ